MARAVERQRPALLREDLAPQQLGAEHVAVRRIVGLPRPVLIRRLQPFPDDRRLAEQDAQAASGGPRRIDRPHGREQRGHIERRRLLLRRVEPDRPQGGGVDVLAAGEPIGQILVARVAGLDEHVVDHGQKARIAHQRPLERLAEPVAVRVAETDDAVLAERLDDGGNRGSRLGLRAGRPLSAPAPVADGQRQHGNPHHDTSHAASLQSAAASLRLNARETVAGMESLDGAAGPEERRRGILASMRRLVQEASRAAERRAPHEFVRPLVVAGQGHADTEIGARSTSSWVMARPASRHCLPAWEIAVCPPTPASSTVARASTRPNSAATKPSDSPGVRMRPGAGLSLSPERHHRIDA
jgi:hypothetical protein